jgi:hypothetical protein
VRSRSVSRCLVHSLPSRSPIQIHAFDPVDRIPLSSTMTPLRTPLSPPPFSLRLPPCSKQMAVEPPTYSPSAAVPPYSVSPAPSERTLAVTARSWRRTPTGVFKRSNSLLTIALRDQEANAVQPSYSRGSTVWGDVALSCTQGVQSVSIKVSAALRHM